MYLVAYLVDMERSTYREEIPDKVKISNPIVRAQDNKLTKNYFTFSLVCEHLMIDEYNKNFLHKVCWSWWREKRQREGDELEGLQGGQGDGL